MLGKTAESLQAAAPSSHVSFYDLKSQLILSQLFVHREEKWCSLAGCTGHACMFTRKSVLWVHRHGRSVASSMMDEIYASQRSNLRRNESLERNRTYEMEDLRSASLDTRPGTALRISCKKAMDPCIFYFLSCCSFVSDLSLKQIHKRQACVRNFGRH